MDGRLLLKFQAMLRIICSALFNPVVLLQVVFGTKDLNVLRVLRRATLRIRDDVIEMKILFAATLNAATFVSLPDFQFNRRRYNSIVIRSESRARCRDLRLIYDLESELKHLTSLTFPCQASTSLNSPLYTQMPSRIFSKTLTCSATSRPSL